MTYNWPDYTEYGTPAPPNYGQNPTLVPNVDPFIANPAGYGGSNQVPIRQVLQLFPRQPANGTVTFTGSVTTGDSVVLQFENGIFPLGGQYQISTLALSTDSLATIAERLGAQINTDPLLNGLFGVTSEYSVVSSNPVLTINWPGPVGNVTLLSGFSQINKATILFGGTATAADVLTLTFASSQLSANQATLTLSGTVTTGDVIGLDFSNPSFAQDVTLSYTVQVGDTLTTIATALVTAINASTSLKAIGLTSSSEQNQIAMSWGQVYGSVFVAPSATRSATEILSLAYQPGSAISALAPSPQPSYLITLTGSATTNDVISVVVRAQQITTLAPLTVSYTVQGGDTLTSIATGLAAAFNGNALLVAGGFVATHSGATVTIVWNSTLVGSVNMSGFATASSGTNFSLQGGQQSISVTYTVQGGDTLSTIATAFTNAINANVALKGNVLATVSSQTISAFIDQPLFPLTVTSSKNTGATETITITAESLGQTITIGGSITVGDEVNILVANPELAASVQIVYQTVTGDTLTTVAAALAQLIDENEQLYSLMSAGNSGAVITLEPNPEAQPSTVTGFVNGLETLTVGGTITTGDTVTLTVTDAGLSGGHVTLPAYTVLVTDTTTTIATALKGLINASAALAAIGVTATSSGAVVDITSTSPNHTTYSVAKTGTTETYTLASLVTETVTIANTNTGSETVTATELTGGSGPVIPLSNFEFAQSTSVPSTNPTGFVANQGVSTTFRAGVPTLVDYDTVVALCGAGQPIV